MIDSNKNAAKQNSKFLDDYRQMERADFSYFFTENTRWGDSDAMGHINNVLYARYYESARVAYLDELLDMQFANKVPTGVILADMKIAYLQQLHHPAIMQIGARVSRLGGSSMHLDAAVFVEGNEQPISTSRATLVWFDYAQNKTLKIPADIRQTIIAYETIVPLGS